MRAARSLRDLRALRHCPSVDWPPALCRGSYAAQPQPNSSAPGGPDAPLNVTVARVNEQPQHTKSFWAVEPPLPITPPHVKAPPNTRFVPLCFDNCEAAFRGLSTSALLRSIGVFHICGYSWLVKNADLLWSRSRAVFGKFLPGIVIKHTFYGHFCAGEDQERIQPTVRKLRADGIGSILDYAAETDVHSEAGVQGAASRSSENHAVIVRTYDYQNERKCDSHVGIFMRALEAAKTLEGQGFAAIKVTALGDPALLEKLSRTINEVKRLFSRFDRDGNGYIGRDEFFDVYDELFTDYENASAFFARLDRRLENQVDYVSFVDQIKMADIPTLTSRCRHDGPLKAQTPTEEELELMGNMLQRVRKLCKSAAEANLRIMIDAEKVVTQPAIDSITKDMQAEFNKEAPIVYNTYQCYLKDSRFRLNADIETARRQGYKFGAKLVRGAYMEYENRNAVENGEASPVHDTLADTHSNYNRCVRMLIQEAASSGAEVMIATHNQYSVEMAVRSMHDFGLHPPSSGVFFGQLLGMADYLSRVLGRHGYRAYKYVPFGPLEEVMPYLIRRAQENSDMMGGVGKEMGMLQAEVKRRWLGVD